MKCACTRGGSLVGMTSEKLTDVETLDYYDGDLTAVARCRECQSCLIFSVVAWEPYAELSVSSISEDDFIRVLKEPDEAQVVGSLSEPNEAESFDVLLDGILQRYEPVMLAVGRKSYARDSGGERTFGQGAVSSAARLYVGGEASRVPGLLRDGGGLEAGNIKSKRVR